MPGKKPKAAKSSEKKAESYRHPEAELALRPEVGTQAQFRKKKPPVKYRYDDSLSPALDWDGQNLAREQGEAAIGEILDADTAAIDAAANADQAKAAAKAVLAKIKAAASKLQSLGRPYLNWSGKAERLSFAVPTLPLFVHERLSTKAIVETLKSHEKSKGTAQSEMFELFGDPKRSVADQVLRAYEYKDRWVNRLILGDSLVVMNSLLHYENLGGQVQMIYVDPPYGVKFGSNFQPFVRDRDVTHNDDADMTREPEMVKAYRDAWELGLHSYLTYLRDRLLLARELLHPSGSVFVQISDTNIHHVRELMDEVFGAGNFGSLITFAKTTGATTKTIPTTSDYLLWYARDISRLKFKKLYIPQTPGEPGAIEYRRVELPDGEMRPIASFTHEGKLHLPPGAKVFATDSIVSKGGDDPDIHIEWRGKHFRLSCKPNRHWKAGVEGTRALWEKDRLLRQEGLRIYKRYLSDFPFREIAHVWTDTRGEDDPDYVVQTSTKVVERCLLMATEPGDLVLDPTCGGGTTAYVAEQWGRRWITIDTSRVPLALTRQRLLTATFPYYSLNNEARGPAGGFVYQRKQNKKGEEIGGIVPHITLGSLANNEPVKEEVLVDRPEQDRHVVRVTGPFAVEATIPTPIDLDADDQDDAGEGSIDYASYVQRMLEVLRKSPVLQVGGGKAVRLTNIRPPVKSMALSAEAFVEGEGIGRRASTLAGAVERAHEINVGGLPLAQRPVAIVFGPESGAVSEKLVFEAAREAHAKNYAHLYVIGFAVQANARSLIETSEAAVGISATFVTATHDLAMGDLLKTTRASQIFAVCGIPEARVIKLKPKKPGGSTRYQVELLGYDVFDPITMELDKAHGKNVPAWMLDTDYNGLVFHGSQVFFPRTSAWDSLRKALHATHDESVWDHLAGTVSAPFEAGEYAQVAVKVIDDRGNELLVIKDIKDATPA